MTRIGNATAQIIPIQKPAFQNRQRQQPQIDPTARQNGSVQKSVPAQSNHDTFGLPRLNGETVVAIHHVVIAMRLPHARVRNRTSSHNAARAYTQSKRRVADHPTWTVRRQS